MNDIGAVCYFADIRLCDLWGLGSVEVARLRRAGRFDTTAIAEITERAGVEIAIVYESWYRPYGGLPPTWRALGTWRVAYNVILGGDTVTLYAVAPGSDGPLIANLRAYADELPADVEQGGAYREGAD